MSEADPLPNVVCQVCWATTKSFHELYKKSKKVQEKFLKSLVKIDPDPIGIELTNDNVARIPIVEEIDSTKLEQNADDPVELDNEPLIDDGSDAGEFDDDSNEENAIENVREGVAKSKTRKPKKKYIPSEAKKKNEEYRKMFHENRHVFDMSCDCCPKVFESLDEARAHYLSEHNIAKGYIKTKSGIKMVLRCNIIRYIDRYLNPDKFKCIECDRSFSSKTYLAVHMEAHQRSDIKSNDKLMQCDVSDLRVHKNAPPDDKLYSQFVAEHFDLSCDQCDAKFTSLYDARRHYKDKHNEENGYIKCCGQKLMSLSIVRDHINLHLNPDIFKCDVGRCDKTFLTRRLLIGHKSRHKTFICDYCSKKFRSKRLITNHLFTKHVTSKPKFECTICQKKFMLKNLLEHHNYVKHREKKASVICELCGKSFPIKFYLHKHMETAHTDKSERLTIREKCKHCGEWLLSKSGIFYHKQLHTLGIQKCDQCGIEFPNRPSLLAHIRKHHRPHKFKCSYCEKKTFSSRAEMRRHEESHTRHKIYECKFCPKVFSVAASHKTHTRRNHKEENEMRKMNEKPT